MTGMLCHDPIWISDDFSTCFQRNYLQSLLPLTTCAISAVFVLFSFLRRKRMARTGSGEYRPLPGSLRHSFALDEYEMDTYRVEAETYEELAGIGSVSDAPSGIPASRLTVQSRTVSQALEMTLVVSGLILNTAALIEGASLDKELALPAVSRVMVWVYLLLLNIVQLKSTALSLRYQALFVSAVEWLTSILVLRTHLVHPRSKTLQLLATGNLFLFSILILIPLTRNTASSSPDFRATRPPPSPESNASILGLATFSWVNGIIWKGYKKSLKEEDVWDLNPQDSADNVIPKYKSINRTSSLTWHLIGHFKLDLLRQALWAVVAAFITFLPTLLVRSILEYVENTESLSRENAWTFVLLLFVSGLSLTVAEGQAFWIGRKTCVRLRAILISEIFERALKRSVATSRRQGHHGGVDKWPRIRGIRKLMDFIARMQRNETSPGARKENPWGSEGALINLMAVDSFKVGEASAYIHYLVASTPIQITVGSIMLYHILGVSALAGICSMIMLLPVNAYISKRFAQAQKRVLAETDLRMHATNELLTNIRIIKLFAWEARFTESVTRRRTAELAQLRNKYLFWTVLGTVSAGTPALVALLSFSFHTLVQKRALTPSLAFPALSLLQILKIPLDQLADTFAMVLEAKISLDRIESFLNEPNTEKYSQLRHAVGLDECPIIGFDRASFSWGELRSEGATFGAPFGLVALDFQFRIGELNLVIGPTGSGKTSLLMALLGEMKLLTGDVYLPGSDGSQAQNRHFAKHIAYCAQQAWLFNGTVKQNIVFSSPWDEARYSEVIAACSLEKDLELFPSGSATPVGQKGMTLSGGQRQRISLARALYSKATHLILDDVLSAVDSNTAKWITERALTGPLARGRTRILVSHNTPLLLPHSKYMVVLNNGHVSTAGDTAEVISQMQLDEHSFALEARQANLSPGNEPGQREIKLTNVENASDEGNSAKPVDGLFHGHPAHSEANDHSRESKTGYVLFYFRSMGHWQFWLCTIALFGAQQLSSVGMSFWIRHWSMQYDVAGLGHSPIYYVAIYGVLSVAFLALTFLRRGALVRGSLVASQKLHSRLLEAVSRAQFAFFDSTPVGQILNRMSKDVEQLDQEIAPVAGDIVQGICSILTIIIVITSVVPVFLLPALLISAAYCLIGHFYVHTSRDLKRLEAGRRSPLFQQLSEIVSGMVTIRAYGDEPRLYQSVLELIDAHSRPFSLLWASNRWLGFRLDMIGALVSFLTGFVVVLYSQKIDAGAAGLILVYAISFTENVLWLVRQYAKNEQNSNAIERIVEYCDIAQESASPSDPPVVPGWPSRGSVEFINFSASYDKAHGPVLKNLTFCIKPLERVAIVGRTGSGKSSLVMALVRALEAGEGNILVDGRDIRCVSLHELRRSIAVVPQDPSLFAGTIRSNVDPFGRYSDHRVLHVLRKVHLLDDANASVATRPRTAQRPTTENQNPFLDLNSPVSAENSGLSQGQRQLLCLARALLQGSKILVMDEATASIDYATDARIQTTIRELKGVTIISITHRPSTVSDFEKVITLDKGEVVEIKELRNASRE